MSAELPALERLLADAAERHYGPRRRRLHVPLPRPALVVAVVATAAAIALAVVLLPLGSDERAATPRPERDPAAALADRYAVFAATQQRTAVGVVVLEAHKDIFDSSHPVSTWLLGQSSDRSVVALVGTARDGKPAICLWEDAGDATGGSCGDVSALLGDPRLSQPWFPFGTFGRTDDSVLALVPDDVTAVRMELESGATRNVPIANSLAFATARQPVCQVTWTTSDGVEAHRDVAPLGSATTEDAVPVPASC